MRKDSIFTIKTMKNQYLMQKKLTLHIRNEFKSLSTIKTVDQRIYNDKNPTFTYLMRKGLIFTVKTMKNPLLMQKMLTLCMRNEF